MATRRRRAAWWIAGIAALIAAAYAAFELSPWPSALVYRTAMDWGGEPLNAALEPHVPVGVVSLQDQSYEADAALDVLPSERGRRAVADDRLDPRRRIPLRRQRADRQLPEDSRGEGLHQRRGELLARARRSLSDTGTASERGARVPRARELPPAHRLYLAGDSAGAHIAAQLANSISVPPYAKALGISRSISCAQLRGVILHCGVYDLALARLDGAFGHFMRTAIWSYGGRTSPAHMPEFSVTRYASADFPPAFITAGNGDPLLAHSHALAEALVKVGAKVDTLFFAADYQPRLLHEYPFNLDTDAGRLARERTLSFLTQ